MPVLAEPHEACRFLFKRATWRFMGTYNHNHKYTYNLLRGLRGLISAVIIGVIGKTFCLSPG